MNIDKLYEAIRTIKHPQAAADFRKKYGERSLVVIQEALVIYHEILDNIDMEVLENSLQDKAPEYGGGRSIEDYEIYRDVCEKLYGILKEK